MRAGSNQSMGMLLQGPQFKSTPPQSKAMTRIQASPSLRGVLPLVQHHAAFLCSCHACNELPTRPKFSLTHTHTHDPPTAKQRVCFLWRSYDYPCNTTLLNIVPNTCAERGNPKNLSHICDEDPRCRGFVWFEYGRANLGKPDSSWQGLRASLVPATCYLVPACHPLSAPYQVAGNACAVAAQLAVMAS